MVNNEKNVPECANKAKTHQLKIIRTGKNKLTCYKLFSNSYKTVKMILVTACLKTSNSLE